MNNSRIIGKHTLESLTVGMYADNRIVFREYVQNATDAIDSAVSMGIIEQKDGRIDISIDNKEKEIRIRDNGTGIRAQDVYHTLGDIGKSTKRHSENRGFRGIGRLGGLGYCAELQFITSYQGEKNKTVTLWDAKELRRVLQPDNNNYEAVVEVVDAVTSQKEHPEKESEHYFEVVLSGIEEEHFNLLDVENIRDYLSQVAPLPFDYTQNMALRKVNDHLQKLGVSPEEYKIFLNEEQLHKPYRLKLLVNSRTKKNKFDFIKEVILFEAAKDDGTLFFAGWYADTDLSGMIKDDNVNGIRLRKGNILIGDNRTLDEFFGNSKTYQNFNRWFAGEIYVFDEGLIPNARRDDFEKNETYYEFKRKLEERTHKLARIPHVRSTIRSNKKKRKEIVQSIQNIENELSSVGITDTRKEQLTDEVDKLKKKAKTIKSQVKKINHNSSGHDVSRNEPHNNGGKQNINTINNNNSETGDKEKQHNNEELLQKIEDIEAEIENSEKYIELPPTIPRKCRKEIDKIFNIIDRVLDSGLAKELKTEIIKELQPKSKKKRDNCK
ncbi:MAG: hypothetical protein D3904_03415 [Candidatus Electrothrix sp. EH2]|nr:hypothetical protein [Candidatus Electrothrix sp. EH2]